MSDSTPDPTALSDSTRRRLAELWAYYETHWTSLPAWAEGPFGEWFFAEKEALGRAIHTDPPLDVALALRAWLMVGGQLRVVGHGASIQWPMPASTWPPR